MGREGKFRHTEFVFIYLHAIEQVDDLSIDA